MYSELIDVVIARLTHHADYAAGNSTQLEIRERIRPLLVVVRRGQRRIDKVQFTEYRLLELRNCGGKSDGLRSVRRKLIHTCV